MDKCGRSRKSSMAFLVFCLLLIALDYADAGNTNLPSASPESAANGTTSFRHSNRYQVFSFNFDNVEAAYIVSIWILVASMAKIGFHLNNKLSSIFPESCLLIILGIIAGIIVYFSTIGHEEDTSSRYTLHASTFFQFLLPPIILDAGYFMPNRAFFNNLGTILLYAVVGTLWNTFTIGITLWGASQLGWLEMHISLLHCLVFSSLISAVDPVAVLAVFEEIHVNEQLHIIVFGESLLNDAVTVVLYHMFKEYSMQIKIEVIDIFAGILQFFIVGVGGILIGVIFGVVCSFITKYTAHVRVIEPIFVFLLAYLSYLTAEMFHLSGIMALTFCGIVMKQYVIFNISDKSQTTIKYFLKMLSSMTETVIFMMLGTSTIKDNHVWDVVFIFLTIFSCLFYRAIGTLLLTWFANKKRVSKLNIVDQFVMAYGGLRGAIAFALAILLYPNDFPAKDLFVTATILVIMFTVFVQGITIKPLVNALHVRRKHQGQGTMNEQIHERLLDHTMAAIEDITGYHGNHWLRDKWEYYDNNYFKKWLLREKQMTTEHGIMRVHSKLSLKDAMQSVHNGFASQSMAQMQNGQSLLRLIKNYSVTSFSEQMSSAGGSELDIHHNDTIIDMQALDAHYSKKIADDTKTHHLLQENLLSARPKWTKHQKHTLNDEYNRKGHFHHRMRLHLRHMISKHQHYLEQKKKYKAQKRHENSAKLPKNVSFAHEAPPEVTEMHQLHAPPAKVIEETSDDEEGIIQFTAQGGDETDNNHPPVSPVALECELPWKRKASMQESNPIPSRFSLLLPDDNQPPLAQVPSWADNLDYNHLQALSPPIDLGVITTTDGTEADVSDNEEPEKHGSSPKSEDVGKALPPLSDIETKSNPSQGHPDNLLMISKKTPTEPLPKSSLKKKPNGRQVNYELPDLSPMTQSTEDENSKLLKDAPSPNSDSEEEVEIKPFGKLKFNQKGSSPKIKKRLSNKSSSEDEKVSLGSLSGKKHKDSPRFTLHDDSDN